jgi:hypothetical protein
VEARECAATIGLGFTLPANSQESVMDKSGQVFAAEELEAESELMNHLALLQIETR